MFVDVMVKFCNGLIMHLHYSMSDVLSRSLRITS